MVDENKAKQNGWQINMRSESTVMAKEIKNDRDLQENS